jgi:hypothetical protein
VSVENKPDDTSTPDQITNISIGEGVEKTSKTYHLPEEPNTEKMIDKEVEKMGKTGIAMDKGKNLVL